MVIKMGDNTLFNTAWDMVKVEVKPFKLRSRKDNDCEHDMEITDESEHPETGTLYRTLTCSRCGESTTSSPS